MRRARWMLGTTLAAAIVVGVLARHDPTEPAAVPAGPPAAPFAPTAPAAPIGSRPPAADAPSLAEQVERLAAARDPWQAFAAYRLLAECAAPQAPRAFCGAMTERQRQSRLDYLEIAAQGGVPGAALAFAREGPFGDPSALETRPSDPLVREWKAQAAALLVRAAEAGGDIDAIFYLADASDGGSELIDKNPPQAFRYGVALGGIYGDLLGADDALAQLYAPDSERMAALAKDLTPEQRAAELEAARRIVERARAQGRRARQQDAGN